jgi:hypothetical protein
MCRLAPGPAPFINSDCAMKGETVICRLAVPKLEPI